MSHDASRREFLKNSLVVSATLAGASFGIIGPLEAGAEDYPDMSICNGKDAALITRQAVEALGGIKRFVKPGAKVLIKPNMSFARSPETGANTNPLVVREVARMCAEAGASRISIVDNVLNNPADCMKLSKIPEYCKDVPNTHTHVVKNERLFREVSVETRDPVQEDEGPIGRSGRGHTDSGACREVSWILWCQHVHEGYDGIDI